jgi:hypothetical protein
MNRTICIGYDSPHPSPFAVCRSSLRRHMTRPMRIMGIHLDDMRRCGWYQREDFVGEDGVRWDKISEAPMSTEFAISRFLTPFLAGWQDGWSVFMDCDFLAMTDVNRMWDLLNPRYAVMCVQPDYQHKSSLKMDGKPQTIYPRKLWSSMMAFNMSHPANRALTLEAINTLPGRDLHRFCWLPDDLVGALPPEWNWMEGITDPQVSPAMVHYTHGGPWLPQYQDVAFAEEWRRERDMWVAGDVYDWRMAG